MSHMLMPVSHAAAADPAVEQPPADGEEDVDGLVVDSDDEDGLEMDSESDVPGRDAEGEHEEDEEQQPIIGLFCVSF